MRLLLDTHIFLWLMLGWRPLGRAVTAALEAPGSRTWVSPISLWEILILAERGRIVLDPDPVAFYDAARETTGFREAPVTSDVVVWSRRIHLPHQDPADRFICATARVHGLTLVTADRQVLGCTDIDVLAND